MISGDRTLQLAVLVAANAGHAIGGPFLFNQVGKLRRVPMDVRVNNRLAVFSSLLRLRR